MYPNSGRTGAFDSIPGAVLETVPSAAGDRTAGRCALGCHTGLVVHEIQIPAGPTRLVCTLRLLSPAWLFLRLPPSAVLTGYHVVVYKSLSMVSSMIPMETQTI